MEFATFTAVLFALASIAVALVTVGDIDLFWRLDTLLLLELFFSQISCIIDVKNGLGIAVSLELIDFLFVGFEDLLTLFQLVGVLVVFVVFTDEFEEIFFVFRIFRQISG